MTVWANQKGTQTAVIGTEHTLAQSSGANSFQFSVDLTNMVNGDVTELRVYRIVNSAQIQVGYGCYANLQGSPLKEYRIDGSQGVTNGIKVTLKETAGTARTFDWELLADSGADTINVGSWNGTTVATPATAGIPDVNVKNMNNVAATSITTISANQGTTQPINFSGTAGSALVKSDTEQLNGQTVTAGAGVTFPASVASPTNITAGTITTVTNLTNAATSGDLTATMKTSVGTAVAASAVASVTGNVGGNVTGSVGSVTGAVGSVTGNVGGNVTGSVGSLGTTAKTDVSTAVLTTQMTESYSTLHTAPTLAQAVFEVRGLLAENNVASTTVTTKKVDGTTTAETFTLNSSTTPTSITRAS